MVILFSSGAFLSYTFNRQPAKKPLGPVTLLKSTHLVLRIRSADCRSAFAGRGSWAGFLRNGLWRIATKALVALFGPKEKVPVSL